MLAAVPITAMKIDPFLQSFGANERLNSPEIR